MTRKPTLHDFHGELLTVRQIAERTGFSLSKVYSFISAHVDGDWSQLVRPGRTYTFRGKTQTLTDWALETGINPNTLRSRITQFHWPLERALTEPAIDPTERARINHTGGYASTFHECPGTGVGSCAHDLETGERPWN